MGRLESCTPHDHISGTDPGLLYEGYMLHLFGLHDRQRQRRLIARVLDTDLASVERLYRGIPPRQLLAKSLESVVIAVAEGLGLDTLSELTDGGLAYIAEQCDQLYQKLRSEQTLADLYRQDPLLATMGNPLGSAQLVGKLLALHRGATTELPLIEEMQLFNNN